jgi:hypothetical protein
LAQVAQALLRVLDKFVVLTVGIHSSMHTLHMVAVVVDPNIAMQTALQEVVDQVVARQVHQTLLLAVVLRGKGTMVGEGVGAIILAEVVELVA